MNDVPDRALFRGLFGIDGYDAGGDFPTLIKRLDDEGIITVNSKTMNIIKGSYF